MSPPVPATGWAGVGIGDSELEQDRGAEKRGCRHFEPRQTRGAEEREVRTHDAGDGPGCSKRGDRKIGREPDQRRGRGETGEREEREEPGAADPALQPWTEDQQQDDAAGQLQQAAVQEHRGQRRQPRRGVGDDAGSLRGCS
jgi:hypothetical protein